MTAHEEDSPTRRVVVTGGASGIGAAIVDRHRRAGDQIVVVDPAAAEDGSSIGADVADHDDARSAVDRASELMGGLDVLVCSAGIHDEGTVADTSPEAWDRVFAVNVRGVFSCAQAAIPHMLEAGGGSIVAIASQHGMVGFANSAAYCASKAAVINLVRCLAIDHAAQGIRANAVCPGPTQTPMLDFLDHQPEEVRERLLQQQLTGRFVQPEEVADAAFFLTSGAAPSILGTSIVVDGGYTAR